MKEEKISRVKPPTPEQKAEMYKAIQDGRLTDISVPMPQQNKESVSEAAENYLMETDHDHHHAIKNGFTAGWQQGQSDPGHIADIVTEVYRMAFWFDKEAINNPETQAEIAEIVNNIINKK